MVLAGGRGTGEGSARWFGGVDVFVLKNAFVSDVVRDEHFQKVVGHLVHLGDLLKINSHNRFFAIEYPNEAEDSDILTLALLELEIFESLWDIVISLLIKSDNGSSS